MKKTFAILFSAVLAVAAGAQNAPFVAPQGTTLTYSTTVYNENADSMLVKSTAVVKNAETAGDITTYQVEETTDIPDSPLGSQSETKTTTYNAADGNTTFVIEEAQQVRQQTIDNIITMMQQSGQFLSDAEREDFEKQVTVRGGIDLTLNADMAEGTKIPNKSLKINIATQMMSYNMWEGKVLGKEQVATPAGTFDCLKISYVMKVNMGTENQRYTVTDWYAPNVGCVKSVNTDKKGKVLVSQQLVEIAK